MAINTQLVQKYCVAARELLADLATSSGEGFDTQSEDWLALQKARSVSSAVTALVASLQPVLPAPLPLAVPPVPAQPPTQPPTQ